jgi:hypothetical protein
MPVGVLAPKKFILKYMGENTPSNDPTFILK